MRTRFSMAFATLAVALVLVGASGEARATAFSIEGATGMDYSGTLTFQTEVAEIICEVSLRILMEKGIEAIERAETGKVTEARTRSCRLNSGTFRSLTFLGLPIEQRHWTLGYKSFLGTLPNATGFRFQLEAAAMLFEANVFFPVSCLFEGSIEVLFAYEREGLGRLRTTSERPETVEARLSRTLAGICPTTGRMLASLTPTTRTRIREIARSPTYVGYGPRPVEIENGFNSLNVTLRSEYSWSSVWNVQIANETGMPPRYIARIGTCLFEITYGPERTMCRIEVERAERNVRGLGSITVRFRYGYWGSFNQVTPIEINALGVGAP